MSVQIPHVAADRCRCPWCPDCWNYVSRRHRDAAFPVLRQWHACQHLVLTLDPKLFPGPAEAFHYVQAKHVISEFLRSVRRQFGLSGACHWRALHFQQNGFPHWHFLVHADHLPLDEVQRRWDARSPAKGQSFGGVFVDPVGTSASAADPDFWSFPKYEPSPAHPGLNLPPVELRTPDQHLWALISYILQDYESGRRRFIPDWVWNYPDRVQRILHGHGLLPTSAKKTLPPGRGRRKQQPVRKPRKQRTLAERQLQCGQTCVVLDPLDHHFLGRIAKPAGEVRAELLAAAEQAAERKQRSADILALQAVLADSDSCYP